MPDSDSSLICSAPGPLTSLPDSPKGGDKETSGCLGGDSAAARCQPTAQLPQLRQEDAPRTWPSVYGGEPRGSGRDAGGMSWERGCQRTVPTAPPLPGMLRGARADLRPRAAHREPRPCLSVGQRRRRFWGPGGRKAGRGTAGADGDPCALLPGSGPPVPRVNGESCAESRGCGPGRLGTGL